MHHIAQPIKRYLLDHLILYTLIGLSSSLQAAALADQSDTQKSYDYTLQNHAHQVKPIQAEASLEIDKIPTALVTILNAIPNHTQQKCHLPQLLAMATYDPTTQHYRKYLFASNGLLPSKKAKKKAHQLNYHLVKSATGPIIWQILSFLDKRSYLEIKALILPKNTQLCPPCSHMCQHLFSKKLPMDTLGCQRQPFPTTAAPISAIACFYSHRFTDQQRQLAITSIGEQAFPPLQISPLLNSASQILPYSHNNKPVLPYFSSIPSTTTTLPATPQLAHTLSFQPIQPITTQNQLHTVVQLQFPMDTIKFILTNPYTDINTLDSNDKTPLDYAIQSSHIYHFLVERGAKTSQQLKEPGSPSSTDATASHHSEEDWASALPPSGQLLIPANGQCLYTTIIMGYLLPVRQAADEVTARIDQLFGMQPAYYLNQLHQTLQNSTQYLTFLHSDAFSTLVIAFMKHMDITAGTWGGPQEIQTIATKLKVNIQEYYPDPSDPTTLLQANLTESAEKGTDTTLHIVRDTAHPDEVLTQPQKNSAKDGQHYQHYRLKYTLPPPIPTLVLPSQQPSILHKMGAPKKNQPYAGQWFEAAKTGNKKLLTMLYNTYNINVDTKNTKGNTALIRSAYNGNVDCLKYLVQQGANINEKNGSNYTALLYSAINGHVDCLKYLVQQGANINTKNMKGNTPLLLSAYIGHIDCLKYLLKQGADIHAQNVNGHTALTLSAQEGHLDIVKYLLQQGAHINASAKNGYSPLLYSAYKGHLDCVKWLFQQGATIDTKNTKGNTALLLSAYSGHLDCLQFLVTQNTHGIHSKNANGHTALTLSAQKGHLPCVKYLVEQKADMNASANNGYTPLILSAGLGHIGCVNYLVQQKAHLNTKAKDGTTALLSSAYNGHLHCLKYLLQQGADISIRNAKGSTALLLSGRYGHLHCLKYLLQQGADINTQNEKGNTTLLLSARNGHLDCVQYLLQQGADINTQNEKGHTALLWSAYNGHLHCLQFLLQKSTDNTQDKHKKRNTILLLSNQQGDIDTIDTLLQQDTDIHHKNKEINTALLLGAEHGHIDCLKFLLQQGAHINTKDKNGNTPLLLSAQQGHLACLKYLLQQGADIHDKNENGYTALLWSAQNGYLACLKHLCQQGAYINAQNVYGHTALLLSAGFGHLACVKFLLTSADSHDLNLQGFYFSQATLPKDLSSTNLTQTKLPQDLSMHNLTHANLTGQHFTHTNFDGTQLEGAILTDTLCDYQQCFQDHVKASKNGIARWYCDNLPDDLKSIAQVYPHLSQDSHKATLLHIASGLAYLPYWKSTEFDIKVQYWSCKLILLKKQLSSNLGTQLVCTVEDHPYGLSYEVENYCWKTDYPQDQIEQTKEALHHDFDQYSKIFQTGLQQYNCQSKKSWGYHWYKNTIEKNIQGLQKTYPKLTEKKPQQEAADIAFQLSKIYQHQSWRFLLRYLSLQNRLIQFKTSADKAVGNTVHYNDRLSVGTTISPAIVEAENEIHHQSFFVI